MLSYQLSLVKSLHSASEMSTISKDNITPEYMLVSKIPGSCSLLSLKDFHLSICSLVFCQNLHADFILLLWVSSFLIPCLTNTTYLSNTELRFLFTKTDYWYLFCFTPLCHSLERSGGQKVGQKVRLNLELTLCFPSVKNYSFLLFVV